MCSIKIGFLQELGMSDKKVVLFGGSFNPVTLAHVQIVDDIYHFLDIDEIWVLPCGPHRFKQNLINFQHRFDWCVQSFAHNSQIKVLDLDEKGDGSTWNLIEQLKQKYHYVFYNLIGQDNALQIHTWHRWQELVEQVHFIVVPRQANQDSKMDSQVEKFWFQKSPHFFYNGWKGSFICSSQFRKLVRQNNGNEAKKLLPPMIANQVLKVFSKQK